MISEERAKEIFFFAARVIGRALLLGDPGPGPLPREDLEILGRSKARSDPRQ